MLEKTGVPTAEDLAGVTPSLKRRQKGPVAVIECFQNIPCNPCSEACPRGAIYPFADMNDRPTLDVEICNGCGICMSKCPGLAIFVVDESLGNEQAIIKVPYEFIPLPTPGDTVEALDRKGEGVCLATVERVQNAPSQDRTPIVWLRVPRQFSMTVRHFRGGKVHG